MLRVRSTGSLGGNLATYTFIDVAMTEECDNVERVVMRATKAKTNPVLVPDRPWEGLNARVYGTVIFDDEEQLFKMWYISHHHPDREVYNLYAYSEDGMNWIKPELGIVNYKGCPANNIFAVESRVGMHIPSVIKLPDAPPDQRYLCFAYHKGGLNLFHSPDGVHWQAHGNNPVLPAFGDVWHVVYDEKTDSFLATGKVPTEAGRSVAVSISTDGINWDPANQLVLKGTQRDHWLGLTAAAGLWWTPPLGNQPVLDEDQDPYRAKQFGGQIYGMPAFPYADMYVGLVWAYQSDALMETQLAWSRDRLTWCRDPRRTTIIERGYQGSFDSKMIMGTATRPLIVNDEIWLYYGGFDVRHHYPITAESPWKGAAVGLAKWRLDGFVALVNAAGHNPRLVTSGRPGSALTQAVPVVGDRLSVNVDSSDGELRVEVCDGDSGQAIPGFSPQECKPIVIDSTATTVCWQHGDLRALKGRHVRLRFHLSNAWLYSFSFR